MNGSLFRIDRFPYLLHAHLASEIFALNDGNLRGFGTGCGCRTCGDDQPGFEMIGGEASESVRAGCRVCRSRNPCCAEADDRLLFRYEYSIKWSGADLYSAAATGC